MWKRISIGFYLVTTLLAAAVAMRGSGWSYEMGRNTDAAWDDAMWFLACASCSCAVLLLATIFSIGKSHKLALVGVPSVLLLISWTAGFGLGKVRWEEEHRRNLVQIQSAINKLDQFKSRTGVYPSSLGEIGVQQPVLLPRGRHVDEVKYELVSPAEFVLHYPTGWYVHTYHSREGRWETND